MASKSDIDVSKLPGKDALSKPGETPPPPTHTHTHTLPAWLVRTDCPSLLVPGKKAGETLMINNSGTPEVYQVCMEQ